MSLPIACALRMRQMKSAGRPHSSLSMELATSALHAFWICPPIRCGIGPEHGVRGSSAPPSRRISIAIRMPSSEKPCACVKKDTPGMRLRKLRASARAPASGGWINSASQQPRAVRMKSDPKQRKKINGNELQARGQGSQRQGCRAVLPDSIFSFSRMISDPFWGEPCPPKGWSAADCSQMLSLA